MGKRLATCAVVAAALWLASPARAELYRCQGPDGRVTYTDNAAGCPQARKHESTGAVQKVPSRPPTSRPAARAGAPPSLTQAAEAAAERNWRQKKANSEQELAALSSRREVVREAVTWCNRGGELWQKDESGIKRNVSCKKIQRDFRDLDARIQELQTYLDEGLEEECRRSGCLPGWIR